MTLWGVAYPYHSLTTCLLLTYPPGIVPKIVLRETILQASAHFLGPCHPLKNDARSRSTLFETSRGRPVPSAVNLTGKGR